MKFKAKITSRGLEGLGRGYLPTLQRFGKTVVLVLGPEEVHLVSQQEEGPFVFVRLGAPLVFEKGPVCQSKHSMNLIAFEFDLKLFERVLHGASSNDAGEVEMKLSLRRMPNGGDVVSRPYLTFQTVGTLSITSELPISKPFPSSEVDSLVRQIRSDQACPFYVDLMPVAENLNSSLQTLKKLSNACQVTLTRTGDAHVQAFRAQSGCVVGVEYRGMEVVPEDQRMADDAEVVQEAAPTGRLQKAIDLGLGATLAVPTKQMAKIISVCQYTKPSKLLCGISQNAQCLHFVYAYLDQREGGLTDKESMSVKLAAFGE